MSTLKSVFSAGTAGLLLSACLHESLTAHGLNDMTTAEQSSDVGCCFVRGVFLVIGVRARGRSGGAGVGAFGDVVPGEVHAKSANVAGVQGEADQAFLGPDAEGVSDEAEQVCGGFDGERSMIPFP